MVGKSPSFPLSSMMFLPATENFVSSFFFEVIDMAIRKDCENVPG